MDFSFKRTRYRIRSPENTRRGALAYEAVLRQKLARGQPAQAAPLASQQEPTFEQFARTWFDEYVIPNNKPSEHRRKRYALNASLIPFFGKILISKITVTDVERYKAQVLKTGVTNKTVNNLLSIFRTALCSAYERFGLEKAPPNVKWLKCPAPHTSYLTPGDCELVLSHSKGVVRELVLAAIRTGMRQGELKGLQWSSIDWQRQCITVRHSRSDYTKELGSPKNGRERHIPMDASLCWTLLQRKKQSGYVFLDADGKPFNHHRMARRLAKVCQEAELRPIGWHTLRHTFASHLVMKGVPLPAVQALMGHSTVEMTMRYTHLAPSTLRAAIDLLAPGSPSNDDSRQQTGNAWRELELKEGA